MASRKFKAFCRIIDYVEATDPELAELIKGTCTIGALGAMRGVPGITFLMPTDKEYKNKIADFAYSDKPAEVNKAVDMITALIIKDVFKTPSDWLAKKDDIPNSLFPPQHVEVESVAGKEIVFKSGARAVLDDEFIDSSRKSNLSVWKLSGEIPITTDKPAKMKYTSRPKGKTGAYQPTGALIDQHERFKIAIAVENAYVLHELARRSDPSTPRKDIFLKYTLSLIKYIIDVRKDMSLLYDRVLPLISFDKLDFYILLEPHKLSATHLLDDSLIREWWLHKSFNFSPMEIIASIELLITNGQTAMVYNARGKLGNKLNELRQQLSQSMDSRPRGSTEAITAEYAKLESTNSIGGVGPVYPAGLAAYYASEPGLKLLQDELRFYSFGAFRQIEAGHQFDIGAFNQLVNTIGDYLHAGTGDRLKVAKLINNNISKQIAPVEKVREIKIFINSTMFMYYLMTKAEVDSMKQKNSMFRPDPNNITMYNIQKAVNEQHKRLLFTSSNTKSTDNEIAELIRSLDVSKLDDNLRQSLMSKLNAS